MAEAGIYVPDFVDELLEKIMSVEGEVLGTWLWMLIALRLSPEQVLDADFALWMLESPRPTSVDNALAGIASQALLN